MMTRRQFTVTTATSTGGSGLPACSSSGESYDEAAQRIWRAAEVAVLPPTELQRELVRWPRSPLEPQHAVLAFRARTPQRSRSCRTWRGAARRSIPTTTICIVSLGCAAENLVQGALAHGLKAQARASMRSAMRSPSRSNRRQRRARRCSRRSPSANAHAATTTASRCRRRPGLADKRAASSTACELMLLTDEPALERVLEFVVQGNTAQMNDPAFVDELKSLDPLQRQRRRAPGRRPVHASSGNPVVAGLARADLLFGFVFTPKAENDKYARQLRSSAGIAVFVGRRRRQDALGRGRPRLRALRVAGHGARHPQRAAQPAGRSGLAARAVCVRARRWPARRPDLVVRFGRGPKLPRSLRRPVAAVLV